ncbi:hypothetical protein C8J56DRAFT_1158459 [Mycena floridula]|nr:hypothetical protein C8J56DRAFT_1158459 [Mycena floridula]
MSTDCTADIEQHYRRTGEFMMNVSLPTIAETLFWSEFSWSHRDSTADNIDPSVLYVESVVLTVVVLWRKGLNRARTALLALLGTMFIIDTVLFSLDLYGFFYQTREIFLGGIFEGDGLDSVLSRVNTTVSVYNILNVFMLILGDCIVIWRAYAVWTRSKIIMAIPFLFLLGWIVNFPIFVDCYIKHKDDDAFAGFAPTACSATAASALVLSFCANIFATLMILYTAWSFYASQRNLQTITAPLRRNSQVARVLLLLVESGFAYFLLMLLSIVLSLAPSPDYGPALVVEEVLTTSLTSHCAASPSCSGYRSHLKDRTGYGSNSDHPSGHLVWVLRRIFHRGVRLPTSWKAGAGKSSAERDALGTLLDLADGIQY